MEANAAAHWRAALADWAIPPEILEQASVPPWSHPVADFSISAQDIARDTPSERRALEALPPHGSVLDVGCGGGRAAFALLPQAGELTGVDEDRAMLVAFVATAAALNLDVSTVLGRWPDIAASAPAADVVVSHHTFYNVPDLADFASALTAHARRRVVVELPTSHPLNYLTAGWQHFWGLARPSEPTVELALAVVREAGWDARIEVWQAQWGPGGGQLEAQAEHLTRRLCLDPSRVDEVAEFLRAQPLPASRELATIWWEP